MSDKEMNFEPNQNETVEVVDVDTPSMAENADVKSSTDLEKVTAIQELDNPTNDADKKPMGDSTKNMITGILVGALAATLIFIGVYFFILKDETLITSKQGNITKDELYESLKEQSGKNQLKSLVYETVLEGKYGWTNKDIDQAMKELETQYGDELESLIVQNGYSSVDEFKKSLNFKLNTLITKAVKANTEVTEDEINAYYATLKPQIRASHILVDTEEKANEILAKINNGEDFATLAKENSKDTGSAAQGGDLGFFGQGEMVEEFETAAYKLKVGEVSPVVQSEHGYHIIKLTETKEKDSYENMKEEIRRTIAESKNDDEAITKILDKLIKEADIKIKDSYFKDILK